MRLRKQMAEIPQTEFLLCLYFYACLLRIMEYYMLETAKELLLNNLHILLA